MQHVVYQGMLPDGGPQVEPQKKRKQKGNYPWQGLHVETGAKLWVTTKQDRNLLMVLNESGKQILCQRVDQCGVHYYCYNATIQIWCTGVWVEVFVSLGLSRSPLKQQLDTTMA